MSLRNKYEEWNGQGGHQASGNVKEVGSAAVNFLQDDYVKGFRVSAQQGETDIKLDRVESRDIPSVKFASSKFDDAKKYSDSIGDR